MKHIARLRTRNLLGFTLVELIVVITILVILGTIAFVSLSGYAKGARDSVRITTVASMLKGLKIAYVKSGTFPMPDAPYFPINDSGSLIGYQGSAGDSIVSLSRVSGKTTDPVDGLNYTYSV